MSRKKPIRNWEIAQPCGYVLRQERAVIGSVWPKSGAWYAEFRGHQSPAQPSRGAAQVWVERQIAS